MQELKYISNVHNLLLHIIWFTNIQWIMKLEDKEEIRTDILV